MMKDRVPKIIDLFKDSDPDVRLAAAKAFGQLAKHGQRSDVHKMISD
jgi:HEAT repeat protein